MRATAAAWLAAMALIVGAAPLAAAPAGDAVKPDATPRVQLAQGDYYGGYTYGYGFGWGYGYRPACPYNHHYECWFDPYGYRHCGCVLTHWQW